jgi:flagellar hook assembly protein FlgD
MVRIVVYNTLGNRIRTLLSNKQKAGHYSIRWNGFNEAGLAVSSGIYFYSLQTEGFMQTNRMVLLK